MANQSQRELEENYSTDFEKLHLCRKAGCTFIIPTEGSTRYGCDIKRKIYNATMAAGMVLPVRTTDPVDDQLAQVDTVALKVAFVTVSIRQIPQGNKCPENFSEKARTTLTGLEL